MTKTEALERFRREVCEKADKMRDTPDDPPLATDQDIDWYSMSVGYFLGIGASITVAYSAAIEARYTHNYWIGGVTISVPTIDKILKGPERE